MIEKETKNNIREGDRKKKHRRMIKTKNNIREGDRRKKHRRMIKQRIS